MSQLHPLFADILQSHGMPVSPAAPKPVGHTRAQRLIDRIEAQTRGAAIVEVGALRAMVRNLCAELAAFEPEDGSVEIEFNGERLWVHIPSELIQANGFDISRLLSKADKAAIITIAEEVQRNQRDEDAYRSRYAA